MKKSKYSDSQIVSISEGSRSRSTGEGDLPEIRDQFGVLLPVEVEVRRAERVGVEAKPGARGLRTPSSSGCTRTWPWRTPR